MHQGNNLIFFRLLSGLYDTWIVWYQRKVPGSSLSKKIIKKLPPYVRLASHHRVPLLQVVLLLVEMFPEKLTILLGIITRSSFEDGNDSGGGGGIQMRLVTHLAGFTI